MNQCTHPEELPAEVLDDVASVVGAEVTLLSRLPAGAHELFGAAAPGAPQSTSAGKITSPKEQFGRDVGDELEFHDVRVG